MRLNNADIQRLLPNFMRKDPANIGLSIGSNSVIHDLDQQITGLKTWNQIDAMTEIELDELAWELNIEWYYMATDIETKRQTIKESDLVSAKLGTKWAVEQIIGTFFGSGTLQEWFQYGGEPFHFKVLSDNPSITNENIEQFLHLMDIVKRKSAWLDSIMISLSGNLPLYFGAAYHEATHETHKMGLSYLEEMRRE